MQIIEKAMRLFLDNPVNSWHEHVWEERPGKLNEGDCDRMVADARRMGFDKMMCSTPILHPYCPPEDFRRANDVVKTAMNRHPDMIRGMCFVNPGYVREASAEVRRCVEELGMVGVKLYHQYKIDEPVLFPLVETCIDLDIPILMHAGKVTDKETRRCQPRISNGQHFANIAARYPEATFLYGHIGGGGDWQWSLEALEGVSNVYIDMGGSVCDCPIIEESVKHLGAERILFATDGSFSHCIGKILGAGISDREKRTILEGTAFLKFLKKAGAGTC